MDLHEDADPWIRTVRAVNVVVNGYEKSGGRNNESPYSEATADHIMGLPANRGHVVGLPSA